MQRAGASLASHVDIHSEERLAGALDRRPHSSKGLAAVVKRSVGRVDTARVVLQLWALCAINDLIIV